MLLRQKVFIIKYVNLFRQRRKTNGEIVEEQGMGIRRRGFTLVEVLIVILITGILVAAMMISRMASEASAKATIILSDLRVMKSGAYLFLVESPDFTPLPSINYAEHLGIYMDHRNIINTPHRYSLYIDGNTLWVGVLTGSDSLPRIGEVLEGKAKGHSMPLYGSNNIAAPPSGAVPANEYKAADKAVWTLAK